MHHPTAPTALNQVDTVKVGVNPLVDYTYAGRRLQGRTTTTGAVGGTATYQQDWGYDSHRRINAITNSVDIGGGPQTVADYAFTHDAVGNPRSRITVTGLLDFLGDDRLFGVDDLNRLVGTDYLGSGEAESTSFDLVGNREAHRNRKGETTYYGQVNPVNEFPWIGAWHNGSPRRKKQRASGVSRAAATFWKRVGGQPFEPTKSARSATRLAKRSTGMRA